MTSPDMSSSGNAGYATGAGNSANNGNTGTSGNAGHTDDVSFAKSIGVDQIADKARDVAAQGAAGMEKAADKAKDAASQGMADAGDAMSQLQAKATEFTNRLMDKVNVDDLTAKLEEQVREHPARTLLFAAGAGYLLGRAAKK